MTDQTNEPTGETVPAATDNWNNPMFKQFKDAFSGLANTVVEHSELNRRVKALEEHVQRLEDQLTRITAERDTFRAENGNLKDELRLIKDELGYKSEVLERTRNQVSQWSRRYDEEVTAHNKVKEALETSNDDRDLAVLEVAEWKRQTEDITRDYEQTTGELVKARTEWFELEAKLTEQVERLTAERGRFQDKYDRAKSLAAQIMAMDQQH